MRVPRDAKESKGIVDAKVEARRVRRNEIGIGMLSQDLTPSRVDDDVEVPCAKLPISEVKDEPHEKNGTQGQGGYRVPAS